MTGVWQVPATMKARVTLTEAKPFVDIKAHPGTPLNIATAGDFGEATNVKLMHRISPDHDYVDTIAPAEGVHLHASLTAIVVDYRVELLIPGENTAVEVVW